MPVVSTVVLIAIIACAYAFVQICLAIGRRHALLPPGPPTTFLLGNLLDFPRVYPHLKFSEWAKQYGDVYSLKIFRQTIIVLNTPTAMRELLDKHNAASSNRPYSYIADKLTPDSLNFGTAHRADETWRVFRKASGLILNNAALRKFESFQYAEVAQTLRDFLHDPDDWYRHLQRYTISYFLGILYGKRVPRIESQDARDFLNIHSRFMHALELGTMPPVDVFPVLKYIPEQFAGWKTHINTIRDAQQVFNTRLLASVEARLAKGVKCDVFMEDAIANAQPWGLDNRELLSNLGGTILQGADNTSAAIQSMLLLMVAFPEAVAKAQAEIDAVVGHSRVPTWEDFDALPYVQAFVKECQRFRPVAPLGLPHEMTDDELIEGLLYPRGSIIFINMWRMLHDERFFDEPDVFRPERYLANSFGVKDGVEDDPARKEHLLFGGGRRVCPGVLFANSTMRILPLTLLWGFQFLPAQDAAGIVIPIDVDNTARGFTATPLPAKCQIKPRSSQIAEAIEKLLSSCSEHLEAFESDLTEDDLQYIKTLRSTYT